MNKPSMRSMVLHLKYGSGILLFAFDLTMLSLLGIDLIKVYSLNLDYISLISSEHLFQSFGLVSLVNFFVLFLLPILLALFGNFFVFRYAPERYYKYTTTSRVRSWCLVFHMIAVVVCIYHSNFISEIEKASGMCGSVRSASYCFNSGFTFLEDFRFYLIGAIVIPLINIIAKDSLYKGRELLSHFEFWRMIGAAGEYQPPYGDEIIYVNSASMAPSIKTISAATMSYHHDYQYAVPTSDKARRLLFQKANDARAKLQEYFFDNDETLKKIFSIEFFPGTSRALEAGILRIGDISHIVLSQYEHPSQVDVVKWLCERQRKITYSSIIPASPAFFEDQWETQKKHVCDSIKKDIRKKSGKIAVVISEVHFITGIHVKVAEIISELRSNHNNLVFIIDGSQAAGNLKKPLRDFSSQLQMDDLYYFSAHKWLLSPNTCGVLISHTKNEEAKKIQPYDMFGFSLPTSTIDPNTIFGLSSSLEFLFSDDGLFEKFSNVSHNAKKYFKSIVNDSKCKIEIVQSSTSELNSSLFLAVKPKFGNKWRYNKRVFWEHMRKKGIDLTFIPESKPYFDSEEEVGEDEIKNYLLRISFPYFLVGKNIKNLVEHLNTLLEGAN